HNLYWNDLRITGGRHPLAFGANNCGKGVGGGTVHWASFTPRLHPSDFRIHSTDGVGVDWPISYWDLKSYYELMELELPVSGPSYYPWGVPDAIENGAEIRPNCMVSRIHVGGDRRVTGVSYFDPEGHECFQKARAVVVAGYSI